MINFTMDRMVEILAVAIFSVLIIWVITGTTVAGLKYRDTTTNASAIDDINNTIASYIQKNGEYFTDAVNREEFERALLDLHGLDSVNDPGCKECVNIIVEAEEDTKANNKIQRSTVYNITTEYRYFKLTFAIWGFRHGWADAIPRTNKAYVHQYLNDGNITR